MIEIIRARDHDCEAVLCAAGARPALAGFGSRAWEELLDRARRADGDYAPGEGLSYLVGESREIEGSAVGAARSLRGTPEPEPPPDPRLVESARQYEPAVLERFRSDPATAARLSEMGMADAVAVDHLADLPAEVPDDLVERAARETFWEMLSTKHYPAPRLTWPPRPILERNPLGREQRHLRAAPLGVGAPAAWRMRGGRGEGCRFVDVEQGWNLVHEDFYGLEVELLWGRNAAFHHHGANTLGVVVARDNRLGGVGIAHGVSWVRVASENHGTSPVADTANAILAALPHLGPGDVLLIESQAAWGDGFVPVEVDDVVFDVIRLATALGVTVVEPSGNGGRILDELVEPAGGVRIFDRTARDSGAILVAAATASRPRLPLESSNRGSAVDCYGWGERVVTTGGDAGHSLAGSYNFDFGGTSSAAAIIAGVALVLQGIARRSSEGALRPAELRSLLRDPDVGQPSTSPRRDLIGVMPDLEAILTTTRYRDRLEPRPVG